MCLCGFFSIDNKSSFVFIFFALLPPKKRDEYACAIEIHNRQHGGETKLYQKTEKYFSLSKLDKVKVNSQLKKKSAQCIFI